MNIEQFWAIVEQVHETSPDDMELKCTLLAKELRQLQLDELKSFDDHLGNCFFRSYTWDIWGAAFVICGGCSDDRFMDFRFTLISLGRQPFETALVDADGLARFNINPDWAQYEGYQYVSSKVYKELGGKVHECDCPECRPAGSPKRITQPKEPTGIPFIEWEMSSRFPKLVEKYGFKDSSWVYLKVQKEKSDVKSRMSREAADLLLKAGIIPCCGLIPPFRVVRQVLKSGQSPRSAGSSLSWEPYDLNESHYWSAVMLLEKMSPEEKCSRSELANIKLSLDLKCSGVDNYEDWMESLNQRGLV